MNFVITVEFMEHTVSKYGAYIQSLSKIVHTALERGLILKTLQTKIIQYKKKKKLVKKKTKTNSESTDYDKEKKL